MKIIFLMLIVLLTACRKPIVVTPTDPNPIKTINNDDISIKMYEDPSSARYGASHIFLKVNSDNVLLVLIPTYRNRDFVYYGKDLKEFHEIRALGRYVLKDGTIHEIQ